MGWVRLLKISFSFSYLWLCWLKSVLFLGYLMGDGMVLTCDFWYSLDKDLSFSFLNLSRISLNFISLRLLLFLFRMCFISCLVSPAYSILFQLGFFLKLIKSIDYLMLGLYVMLYFIDPINLFYFLTLRFTSAPFNSLIHP